MKTLAETHLVVSQKAFGVIQNAPVELPAFGSALPLGENALSLAIAGGLLRRHCEDYECFQWLGSDDLSKQTHARTHALARYLLPV